VTRTPTTSYANGVDRDEIMRVLRAFEAAGLEYVLIGAAAMGFHGLVRATEGLDLFIRATSMRSHHRICLANIQPCVTFHPRVIYILMC